MILFAPEIPSDKKFFDKEKNEKKRKPSHQVVEIGQASFFEKILVVFVTFMGLSFIISLFFSYFKPLKSWDFTKSVANNFKIIFIFLKITILLLRTLIDIAAWETE